LARLGKRATQFMKLSRTIDLKSTLSVPFCFGTRPPFEPTGPAAARIMSLTSYQAAPPRFDRRLDGRFYEGI
jgi:hypothetical protein